MITSMKYALYSCKASAKINCRKILILFSLYLLNIKSYLMGIFMKFLQDDYCNYFSGLMKANMISPRAALFGRSFPISRF